MSESGQFLPPSLATAMEELASTPDAKAHNRYATEGKRRARSTAVTGRHGRRPWHLQRAKTGLSRRKKRVALFDAIAGVGPASGLKPSNVPSASWSGLLQSTPVGICKGISPLVTRMLGLGYQGVR
jgi:hypothetical protein